MTPCAPSSATWTKVMKAMPCLDGSRYSTRVVNAWRLAKKELARVTKIIENEKT